MSPRTKEQQEKIREERIVQIRKAFSEVYLEKGLQGTDMGDVAKKAGISRALVYYYYKDKMELFQGMFQEYFEAAKVYVNRSLLTDEEPLVRLERYARFYLETAVATPRRILLYRNMFNDLPLVFGEQAQQLYQEFSGTIHSPLVHTVEEGIHCGRLVEAEPSLLAQTFWGGVAGAMLELARRQQPKDEMDELVEQSLLILFTGITKQPKSEVNNGNDES